MDVICKQGTDSVASLMALGIIDSQSMDEILILCVTLNHSHRHSQQWKLDLFKSSHTGELERGGSSCNDRKITGKDLLLFEMKLDCYCATTNNSFAADSVQWSWWGRDVFLFLLSSQKEGRCTEFIFILSFFLRLLQYQEIWMTKWIRAVGVQWIPFRGSPGWKLLPGVCTAWIFNGIERRRREAIMRLFRVTFW